MFPGKYQSDFAVQVTSQIPEAQQFTINFSNNNLLGSGNFIPAYKTSKARICVTVGMMTTGYDCTDILNLGTFPPRSFHPPTSSRSRGVARASTTSASCSSTTPLKEGARLPIRRSRNSNSLTSLPTANTSKRRLQLRRGAGAAAPLHRGRGRRRNWRRQARSVVGGDLYASSASPDNPLSTVKQGRPSATQGMKIDRMFFERLRGSRQGPTPILHTVAAAVQAETVGPV